MTLSVKETRKCAVCGNESEHYALLSTNTFWGGPDLDTRPAEMKRSTMSYWIQECPHCGYVSENISDSTDVTEEYLKSNEYVKCQGVKLPSELAYRFYKYYILNIKDDNSLDAFWTALHVAWLCDDKGDIEMAAKCRMLAIAQVEKVIKTDQNQESLWVIRADLLRRTNQFEKIVYEYKDIHFKDELLNKIILFEIEKAKENDNGCYRVEDVM